MKKVLSLLLSLQAHICFVNHSISHYAVQKELLLCCGELGLSRSTIRSASQRLCSLLVCCA